MTGVPHLVRLAYGLRGPRNPAAKPAEVGFAEAATAPSPAWPRCRACATTAGWSRGSRYWSSGLRRRRQLRRAGREGARRARHRRDRGRAALGRRPRHRRHLMTSGRLSPAMSTTFSLADAPDRRATARSPSSSEGSQVIDRGARVVSSILAVCCRFSASPPAASKFGLRYGQARCTARRRTNGGHRDDNDADRHSRGLHGGGVDRGCHERYWVDDLLLSRMGSTRAPSGASPAGPSCASNVVTIHRTSRGRSRAGWASTRCTGHPPRPPSTTSPRRIAAGRRTPRSGDWPFLAHASPTPSSCGCGCGRRCSRFRSARRPG